MSMFRFATLGALAFVVASLGACAAADDGDAVADGDDGANVATLDEASLSPQVCFDRLIFQTKKQACGLNPDWTPIYTHCSRTCTLHRHLDDDGACVSSSTVCGEWSCDPCPIPPGSP